MIDWVSCFLPCKHIPINSGMVCKIDPNGLLEWATPCPKTVQGSHEQNITVKSVDSADGEHASELYFSGNPSKFLQGHNIFGSDDLRSLMAEVYHNICTVLDLEPTLEDRQKIRAGDYRLTRVDINYSFQLSSRADVLAWLRAAEFKSKTRHGRPSSKGGTIYWGKTSKRWSLKAYSKGEEIQKHKLPDSLSDTLLPQWADNKLRIELTLRSKELEERTLRNASAWDDMLPSNIYNEFIARLDMTEQIALTTEQLLDLPQRLRSTYVLWKDGHDLRSTLTKATYYRHRNELLERGINIDLRQESIDKTNVVPLLRVLEAMPAELPDWAFEQRLIHPSARQSTFKVAV